MSSKEYYWSRGMKDLKRGVKDTRWKNRWEWKQWLSLVIELLLTTGWVFIYHLSLIQLLWKEKLLVPHFFILFIFFFKDHEILLRSTITIYIIHDFNTIFIESYTEFCQWMCISIRIFWYSLLILFLTN